jgi:predicted metal-dependent phosphotriesterase family hydrolase
MHDAVHRPDPALVDAGVTKDEIRQILVENPRRALTGG